MESNLSVSDASYTFDPIRAVYRLPEELLLQIWTLLPPLERVCASHVSQEWRRVALGSPSLWTRLIFLSAPWDDWTAAVWPYARARSQCEQQHICNVFNPRPGSTNVAFLAELLLRSGDMQLDLTIVPPKQQAGVERLAVVLAAHAHRLSRLHIRYCNFNVFWILLDASGGAFPTLRTLTAGFDDQKVVIDDKPHRSTGALPLPALRQIHLGADANYLWWDWDDLHLTGVDDLTIVPRRQEHIVETLGSCTNLASLTWSMACFTWQGPASDSFRTLLTRVRTIVIAKMHESIDRYVFDLFDDARFRDLTFDCRGRVPWEQRGITSPCHALEQPVRLAVRLRDYAYEITAVDPAQRRRRILLDTHTVNETPGLWDFWLRAQAFDAVTVDAAAWPYFSANLPVPCVVPELTLIVRTLPAELRCVSLTQLSGVERLRIDILKPRLRLPGGLLTRIVRDAPQLRVLSLAADATFEDAVELSALVTSVVEE